MQKNPASVTLSLLKSYSFDTSNESLVDLIYQWLNLYSGKWVIAATLEAIYQGRYKAASVTRILEYWSLKGCPTHHFDYDFADIVYKKLIQFDTCENTTHSIKVLTTMNASDSLSPALQIMQPSSSPKSSSTGEKAHLDSQPESSSRSKNQANTQINQSEKLVVLLTA